MGAKIKKQFQKAPPQKKIINPKINNKYYDYNSTGSMFISSTTSGLTSEPIYEVGSSGKVDDLIEKQIDVRGSINQKLLFLELYKLKYEIKKYTEIIRAKLDVKQKCITFISLSFTILITLLTSEFKEVYIFSAQLINYFFYFALILFSVCSIYWGLKCYKVKDVSEEELIEALQKRSN